MVTGDDIIGEILRNCEAGQFKIRNTTLLPSIYHIYLHPTDFETVRPVLHALTAEARNALLEYLEKLNRRSQPSAIIRKLGFEGGPAVQHKILDPDWIIDFQPDPEDRLAKGEIEIYSELASARQPSFDGEKTRMVTRQNSDGEKTSRQETGAATQPVSRSNVYATIRYQEAAETFEVTKDKTVIGRGGKSYWVDLKLEAPPDVSREHCRIRRDPATGAFYLKDVSQFGVSIDGRKVPTSIKMEGSEQKDINVETALPARCTISLAGVATLLWEASK